MEKHVKKWLKSGYIGEEQSKIILDDIKEEKNKNARLAMNITLYTIGAILTGIGVISFIAANDWILRLFYSRFVKISASLIVTFACFFLGYYFSYIKTSLKRLGSVLIFLSTLLIGGVWALIGQIYNVHTDNNFVIFLLWLISILPVAFLFGKKSVNNLAIVLFIASYFSIPNIYDFAYLTPIVFGLVLYNFANIPVIQKNFIEFTPAYKSIATLVLYFATLVIFCANILIDNYETITTPAIIALAVFLIFALINFVFNKKSDAMRAETMILSGIAILYMILGINILNMEIAAIINTAGLNIILVSIIFAMYHFGYKAQDTGLITGANYFTLIYISVLYFKISYHLLDKALFFFLGGVILLSLGIYLEKQKRVIKTCKGAKDE